MNYLYIKCIIFQLLVLFFLVFLIKYKIKKNLYRGIYIDGLIVKKSNLIGAGNGLFTTVDIPKNTIIGYYKGKIYNEDEYLKYESNGIYLWENDYNNNVNRDADGHDKTHSSSFYIDAKDIDNSNVLRYVNDFKTYEGNNIDIINTSRHIYYKTRRDIKAGSELYVNYGDYYWN